MSKKSDNISRSKPLSSDEVKEISLGTGSFGKFVETDDNFTPRRSQRFNKSCGYRVDGDEDIWVEMKVVRRKKYSGNKSKKNQGGKETTRSLFYSVRTSRAFWDEPPSGASKVIFSAT